MTDILIRKGAIEMLHEGLIAIRIEIVRNFKAGNRTDTPKLLLKLSNQIYDQTGYRYDFLALINLYDLFDFMMTKTEKGTS